MFGFSRTISSKVAVKKRRTALAREFNINSKLSDAVFNIDCHGNCEENRVSDYNINGIIFEEGDVSESTSRMLIRLQEIRSKIIPWSDLVIAPKIKIRKGGIDDCQQCYGLADPDDHKVYISYCMYSEEILTTLYHECWHMCEPYMDLSYINQLDHELFCNASIYDTSTYMNDRIEKRARAFSHYAMLREEGLDFSIEGEAVKLFEEVYSGVFADEIF